MGKYLKHIAVVLLLLLLGTYSCELDKVVPCPCIASIEQDSARAGETITLRGEFVRDNTTKYEITIGDTELPIEITSNEIKVVVPENGITNEKVPVTISATGIEQCNAIPNSCKKFFDYKTVTVTDLDIVKAKHSQEIKISGTNFREGDVDANTVSFNGVTGIVKSASDTELVVEVPVGAKSGAITVEVDGFEASSTENFTYEFTAKVSLLAGSGTAGAVDGTGAAAQFNLPAGIDVFTSGGVTTIYVADKGNHVIRKIDTLGNVSLFAGGFGNPDHINHVSDPTTARFYTPEDVAVGSNGAVYVTESENRTVRQILSKETTTLAGIGDPTAPGEWMDNLIGRDARFYRPQGITATNSGLLYISDKSDNRIRVINLNEDGNPVTTLAGLGFNDSGDADGDEMVASFRSPSGLIYDSNSEIIHVADLNNNRIRSITSVGDVSTVAGSFKGDMPGIGTTALFDNPADVAVDAKGNIFVLDSGNNKIKRIDKETLEVTLVEGSGGGFDFDAPFGICYEEFTNTIYVSDTQHHEIRKIKLE